MGYGWPSAVAAFLQGEHGRGIVHERMVLRRLEGTGHVFPRLLEPLEIGQDERAQGEEVTLVRLLPQHAGQQLEGNLGLRILECFERFVYRIGMHVSPLVASRNRAPTSSRALHR